MSAQAFSLNVTCSRSNNDRINAINSYSVLNRREFFEKLAEKEEEEDGVLEEISSSRAQPSEETR